MGKKMKLPFLFKNHNVTSSDLKRSNPLWPWPAAYCQEPKTLSFRAENKLRNTLNSSHFEASNLEVVVVDDDDNGSKSECIDSVINGLRSDRLFFKAEETSSILEEVNNIKKAKQVDQESEDNNDNVELVSFKQSAVLSLDSQNPYLDFKKSMEEMVEAHGLKDWQSLEELLSCYLRVNAKTNHGYILSAFVDLLVSLALVSSSSSSSSSSNAEQSYCSCSYSPSSPLSFYTSSNFSDDSSSNPCVSSLQVEDEVENDSCLSSSLVVKNEITEK